MEERKLEEKELLTVEEAITLFNHNHCHFYTYANKLGVTCCTKSFHWLKSKFIQ